MELMAERYPGGGPVQRSSLVGVGPRPRSALPTNQRPPADVHKQKHLVKWGGGRQQLQVVKLEVPLPPRDLVLDPPVRL
eukprot:1183253-Prorocentrum_minimum.AAC.6